MGLRFGSVACLQMLSVSLWSRNSVRTAGRHEVQVGRYAYRTNSERTCGGAISIGSSRIEGRRKAGKAADGEDGSCSDHAGPSWSKPTADGTDGTRRMCSGLTARCATRASASSRRCGKQLGWSNYRTRFSEKSENLLKTHGLNLFFLEITPSVERASRPSV